MRHFLVGQTDDVCPESFFVLLRALHDILLELPQNNLFGDIANEISKLCEKWWADESPQREGVCAQTVTYLLVRALAEGAKTADMLRVCQLRECVPLFDFSDISSTSVRELLLQCFLSPLFFQNPTGRSFLASIPLLSPQMMDSVHRTVKNQIPHCRKSMLKFFGEVYSKTWKESTGPLAARFEFNCLQNLVHHAVHAQTSGLAAAIRTLLKEGFVSQKKHPDVDELLLRLVDPIIWRSLRVANPAVRRNATALLVDVFPLQNSSLSVASTEELLARQVNALQEVLQDDNADVRRIAVLGVSRIIGVYWEILPAAAIKTLLSRLIGELAHDSAAVAVRAAVLDGVAYILENHLSQPALKTLLPSLGILIHDTAERVRDSLVSLLAKLKGIRLIKFYEVVKVEDLLLRLPVESPALASRITGLLANSFCPEAKHPAVWIQRCVTMATQNDAAAPVFYSHIGKHVGPETATRFVCALVDAIAANTGIQQSENTKHERGGRKRGRPTSEQFDDAEGEVEKLREVLKSASPKLITALLRIASAARQALDSSGHLSQKQYRHLRENLATSFLSLDPEKLVEFAEGNPVFLASVYSVISWMPSSRLTDFSRHLLAQFGPSEGVDLAVHEPLLECLCAWGQTRALLDRILVWLRSGLVVPTESAVATTAAEVQGISRRRKGARVSVLEVADNVRLPLFALACLEALLRHESTRIHTLALTEELLMIITVLREYLPRAENRLLKPKDHPDSSQDCVLSRAVLVYLKLLLHACGTQVAEVTPETQLNMPPDFAELLEWAVRVVLPPLRASRDAVVVDGLSPYEAPSDSSIRLAHDFLWIISSVSLEALLLGVCSEHDNLAITLFVQWLLVAQNSHAVQSVLPLVAKICASLVHSHYVIQQRGETEDLRADPLALTLLLFDQTPDVLAKQLRPALLSVFLSLHRTSDSTETVTRLLSAMLHRLLAHLESSPCADVFAINIDAEAVPKRVATTLSLLATKSAVSPNLAPVTTAVLAHLLDTQLSEGPEPHLDPGFRSLIQLAWLWRDSCADSSSHSWAAMEVPLARAVALFENSSANGGETKKYCRFLLERLREERQQPLD
eukprot:TRINITY_DN9201_c0_g1_i2.p1 TRINITY_DN9201_c0_g1~~TRINITY_DN9201_c0_g1_i2.p1  ORF type:complete len:1188 (-),score=251.07 TRINITY_DN9201_c0_g1_i2:12-3281(-)